MPRARPVPPAGHQESATTRLEPLHPRRSVPRSLGLIVRGEFDPTFVISHRLPLAQAPEAYRLFDEKADQALKIVLQVG